MRVARRLKWLALLILAVGAPALLGGLSGCASQPMTPAELAEQDRALRQGVDESIAAFKQKDPSIQSYFDKAYGYAVFPRVTKGGVGIGGSRGNGRVFERGRVVGAAEITKLSIGLQLGGQVFREIIFFEDRATMDLFKAGQYALSAEATGAAAADGAAASANYAEGVAVFVMPIEGFMFEAAIGGQRFRYSPL
ncbi:MAG: hypothetical protein ACR2RL_02185 [Gammaproteobacteria bacterium]